MRRWLSALVLTAAFPGSAAAAPHVPHQILVRFRASVTGRQRAAARGQVNARSSESLAVPGWQLVQLPADLSVADALAAVRGQPGVSAAEPNGIVHAMSIPTDPALPRQWALHNTGATLQGIPGTAGADIDAPGAWAVTTGSRSVKVAVVDSGMRYDDRTGTWSQPFAEDGDCADGARASATCFGIAQFASTPDGGLVATRRGLDNLVWRITPDGHMYRLAGDGVPTFGGDAAVAAIGDEHRAVRPHEEPQGVVERRPHSPSASRCPAPGAPRSASSAAGPVAGGRSGR